MRRDREALRGAVARALIVALALLLAAGCRRAAPAAAPEEGAGGPPVYGALGEARLIDQDGRPFAARELRGGVWIAAFMYTTCPMECPVLAQRMSYLQKLLAGRRPSIRLLSVSVNPGQDTPAALRAFAGRFQRDPARWTLVTGETTPVLRAAAAAYDRAAAAERRVPPGGFAALHGDLFVLIDGEGRVRGYYRKDDAGVARLLDDADRLAGG